MKKRFVAVLGMAAVLVGASIAGPALAAEDDSAVTAVENVAPEVLDAAAAVDSDSVTAAGYSAELVTTSVPRDPSEPVSLSGPLANIEVALPFAGESSNADTDGAAPEFDNNNGSSTVSVVRDDASVQILTVIDNAAAPTRYDYTISLSDGGYLQLDESGIVFIRDQDSNFVGAIAPAWARDANGESVSTHYEIDGNILTQVVDHSGLDAYPIVADPWLGIQLFNGFYRGTWNGDYTYNASVTPLGAVILGGGGGVGGYLAGQLVFRTNGWDEWKAVWPAITNKATLKQQFDCHVTASVYGLPFTGTYNLERARANNANWGANVLSHHCNW